MLEIELKTLHIQCKLYHRATSLAYLLAYWLAFYICIFYIYVFLYTFVWVGPAKPTFFVCLLFVFVFGLQCQSTVCHCRAVRVTGTGCIMSRVRDREQ